jgi:hypothetical protein
LSSKNNQQKEKIEAFYMLLQTEIDEENEKELIIIELPSEINN